jgi:hypothetical protein
MGRSVTLLARGTEMKLQREIIARENTNTARARNTIIFNFAVAAALINVLFFYD